MTQLCSSGISFQGNESSYDFGTSNLCATFPPVALPLTGAESVIGNLLQPSTIQEERFLKMEPEPTVEKESYDNSFVHPSIEEWGQDCLSKSGRLPSCTDLVMQVPSNAPPQVTPLLSCTSDLNCEGNERVLDLPLCSFEEDDDIECERLVCRCSISYCHIQSKERHIGCGRIVKKKSVYYCKKCFTTFTRQPDLNRHLRGSRCGERVPCRVCKKLLCRKDAVMRHLCRRDGRNRCSRFLEDKQISKEAVASGRVSREDLGTDMEIEAALTKYENSELGV